MALFIFSDSSSSARRYSLLWLTLFFVSLSLSADERDDKGDAANQYPVANAGVDQSIDDRNLTITLDGDASSDSDGAIVAYVWKQTAGTSVKLSNSNTAQPAFTSSEVAMDETLTFELTVTDNKGISAKDTVDVIFTGLVDKLSEEDEKFLDSLEKTAEEGEAASKRLEASDKRLEALRIKAQ